MCGRRNIIVILYLCDTTVVGKKHIFMSQFMFDKHKFYTLFIYWIFKFYHAPLSAILLFMNRFLWFLGVWAAFKLLPKLKGEQTINRSGENWESPFDIGKVKKEIKLLETLDTSSEKPIKGWLFLAILLSLYSSHLREKINGNRNTHNVFVCLPSRLFPI